MRPTVLIESVRLNGKLTPNGSGPSGFNFSTRASDVHDLEIDYIGINLSAPERVSYRYLLVGADKDWREAGSRRQAFYMHLSPGSYRFMVSANNGAGTWSTLATPMMFEVRPAIYQTWWFRAGTLIVLLALLWLASVLRTRQVASSVRMRMEARADERLRIARELHDTLLQSVHGLMLHFHYAKEKISVGQPAREHLESALTKADEVISEGRRRVQALRSEVSLPENFGAELACIAEELCCNHQSQFHMTEQGVRRPLHPYVQQELSTISREALANAFEHSGAARIDLHLCYGNLNFKIRCTDDGVGMESSVAMSGRSGHWGLIGMQERAKAVGAQLALWSAPGGGTELEISIPAYRCYRDGGILQQLWRVVSRHRWGERLST
ncbi:MAG: triple tyrosine motif-containing protein [Bryobacteraceae bacterium]